LTATQSLPVRFPGQPVRPAVLCEQAQRSCALDLEHGRAVLLDFHPVFGNVAFEPTVA
jgi:hypothetical protein